MDVEPKLGALFEKIAEFEGHFRRDAAATEHDFLDVARADAKGSRKGVLGNAHGNEVVLKKDFAGRNSGFHLEKFAASRELLPSSFGLMSSRRTCNSNYLEFFREIFFEALNALEEFGCPLATECETLGQIITGVVVNDHVPELFDFAEIYR